MAAHVDFRKAFDSVNQDALWRILALRGIPPKLVNPISGLYSGTESAVRCDGTISYYLIFNTAVRQGCVLAPTFFNSCMDHVPGRMSEKSGFGLLVGTVQIIDLDFANDAVISAETTGVLREARDSLSEEAEPFGLLGNFLDQAQASGVQSHPGCDR